MGEGIKRGRKADATRTRLLDAALRVIGRKGYSAATVDEIVQEAGVSKGLAYYHFKNKADMAGAVLRTGLDRLTDEFERNARQAGSAAEALNGMLDSFTDAVIDNREFGRFFFSELWREERTWSDEMRDSEERLVGIIAEQFERGQREGTVDPHTDATFDAVSCIGLVLTTSLCYFGQMGIAEPLDRAEFASRVRTFVSQATLLAA